MEIRLTENSFLKREKRKGRGKGPTGTATVLQFPPDSVTLLPSLSLDRLKLLLSGPHLPEEEPPLISPMGAFVGGLCSRAEYFIPCGTSLSGHMVNSHPDSRGLVGTLF